MTILIEILTYLLFPALVIFLCYKYPFANKIGAVVICYVAGITIGNLGFFPGNIVQEPMSEVAVALALPLLLFSTDILKWKRLAGKTMLSMLLGTLSIIIVSLCGFLVINDLVSEAWQLSGMAVGVYTGGTPNLAALKTALNIDPSRFLIVHTYDTLVSIIFIIFCITIAQRFFLTFLPEFQSDNHAMDNTEKIEDAEDIEDIKSYSGLLKPQSALPLFLIFLLSLSVTGCAVCLSTFLSQGFKTSFIILFITTMGIAGSMIPKIRSVKYSFQLGMYIIYVFCFIVGSMAKYEVVANIRPVILIFVTVSVFGTMLLHSLFCRIFNIDADTFLITSTSAICSPPFVPVVAGALRNREVILSGLTTGIIGYAVGNYLGISMALILKNWF
ncbi:MAG: DUF819 family protein [Desulfobacteraceae bacterium]|nr:DUF819 family protein [Desulfobacteraceae bacterium]